MVGLEVAPEALRNTEEPHSPPSQQKEGTQKTMEMKLKDCQSAYLEDWF